MNKNDKIRTKFEIHALSPFSFFCSDWWLFKMNKNDKIRTKFEIHALSPFSFFCSDLWLFKMNKMIKFVHNSRLMLCSLFHSFAVIGGFLK